MSVVFSGNNSGYFTSDGTNKLLALPSGVDVIQVTNETQAFAAGGGQCVYSYWRRGMSRKILAMGPPIVYSGVGIQYTKTAVTGALVPTYFAANNGFYLYDSSVNTPYTAVSYTAISGATPPVVSTAATGSLAAGDIVRLTSGTGCLQVGGIDYTVGTVVANTSFTLAYQSPIVAAAAPGTNAFWRKIPYDPIFYPRNRTITNISQATQAIVTMSVTHGFTVGQEIRLVVPRVGTSSTYFGMTEADGLQATIVAVGAADANGYTNTITIDLDTTAFTAFAWPLSASGRFTPPQVVPVGENTAEALSQSVNILGDSTENQASFGIILTAGANGPGGVNNDVISWIAYKSFNQ